MTGILLALSFRRQEEGLRQRVAALATRWRQARRRRELRRYIMEMDEHMLSDIGVSRAQALFDIDAEHNSG